MQPLLSSWRIGRPLLSLFGRVAVAVLVLWATAWLAGCGGGGPPAQEPLPKPDLVGHVYPFTGQRLSSSPAASAKGATGVMRTSNPAVGDDPFRVTASGLTSPFIVRAGGLLTVAFEAGPADTSLLTNLVVAVLAGQAGDAVFEAFGPGSAVTARTTPEAVASAETKVRAFLANDMGITLPAGLGSLLAQVNSQVGDPLYDTILAYGQRRLALGEAAYLALEANLIADAHACIEEHLDLVDSAGVASAFCPTLKQATRDTQDQSVVVYGFTDRVGAHLEVELRGDQVARASFQSGDAQWACAEATCIGIVPQAALQDDRRPIGFSAATLKNAAGSLVFTGSLVGAAPGVVLPPLPCDVNRFHLVLPTREVIGDCADISPPVDDIGIAGTYGLTQGTTRRLTYPYVNQAGSNGQAPSDAPVTISVVLEGSTLISVTATRTDTVTGLVTLDFKCRAEACNGVTVSPPTINTDFGLEIQIRDVQLTGTQLAQVGTDGSLSTDTFATLTAVTRAIDIVSTLDNGMLSPPPNCDGAERRVRFSPGGETVPYDYCTELSFAGASTRDNEQGGLHFELQTGNTTGDMVAVDTDSGGLVVRVVMAAPSYNQAFACDGNCVGATVSGPDAQGRWEVRLDGVVLRGAEPDGFAGSDRVATGTGSFLAPPASPP